MFDGLSTQLSGVFDRLGRKGRLSKRDIEEALGEIRTALLEADVALTVVRDLIGRLKEDALGEQITRSVTPSQEIIKRMNDLLVEVMSPSDGSAGMDVLLSGRNLPETVVMLGLQGSGKTTTTAKLAKWLKDKNKKKVLLASCDIYRPKAKEQLQILGEKIGIDVLDAVADEDPVVTAKRAHHEAKRGIYDHLLLDTAGRLTIDDELMTEIERVAGITDKAIKILVADALSGQDAARTAASFHERVGLDGAILSRIDGDSRGGAALSVSAVSGCGIWFVGSGEAVDKLEPFDATRIASRILGMGDVVSLVEKAREVVSEENQEKMMAKMAKGRFDLEDFASQIEQIEKMGSLSSLLGMIPGMGKLIKGKMGDDEANSKMMRRQLAIIRGMTKKERADPRIIHASRKKRIANGSGVAVSEVNKLLKQHQMMSKMMKKVGPSMQAEMLQQEQMPQSGKGGMALPPSFPSQLSNMPLPPGVGGAGMPSQQDLAHMLGLGRGKKR